MPSSTDRSRTFTAIILSPNAPITAQYTQYTRVSPKNTQLDVAKGAFSGKSSLWRAGKAVPIKAENKIDAIKLPVMKISIEFNSFDLYRFIHEHRRMKKSGCTSKCVCVCVRVLHAEPSIYAMRCDTRPTASHSCQLMLLFM